MNSVCSVNSTGRLVTKTDIAGKLVGIFTTSNTQLNATVFNVRFRFAWLQKTVMSNKTKTMFRKKGWSCGGGEEREMEDGRVKSRFLLLCSTTGSVQISAAPEDALGQILNLIMSPEKTNLS